VHVIANPDRIKALSGFLPRHPEIGCVLLDDGFQHRRIKRDLDVVLIDATAGTFSERLLPAGNLREPVESLKRADAVIITHAESQISDLKSRIERHHGKAPIAWCRHVWTRLDVHENNKARRSHEIEWLRGKRVVTMLGVANPRPVVENLRSLGADINRDIPVRDHNNYTPNYLKKLASLNHSDRGDSLDALERVMEMEDGKVQGQLDDPEYDALVVTAKDWVKLQHVIDWNAWRLPIVVPRLEIEFVSGAGPLLERIMTAVRAARAGGTRC
jgi:tetraacyldisaccharide-1-P 4'-kinase